MNTCYCFGQVVGCCCERVVILIGLQLSGSVGVLAEFLLQSGYRSKSVGISAELLQPGWYCRRNERFQKKGRGNIVRRADKQ